MVDFIVTEMGWMRVTPDGLLLEEIDENYTVEQVQKATEARLLIAPDLKPMPGA